jgi:hypothetical protein
VRRSPKSSTRVVWSLPLLAACAAGAAPGAPSPDSARERRSTANEPLAQTSPRDAASPTEVEPPSASKPSPPAAPLNHESIRAVVRASYDTMTACYLQGLRRDPSLGGTIDMHLVIDDDGKVVGATAPKGVAKPGDERLLDAEVVGCVERAFTKLAFPPTGRGMLTLTYPVVFHLE